MISILHYILIYVRVDSVVVVAVVVVLIVSNCLSTFLQVHSVHI